MLHPFKYIYISVFIYLCLCKTESPACCVGAATPVEAAQASHAAASLAVEHWPRGAAACSCGTRATWLTTRS